MWSPLHIPRELKTPEERQADDEWLQRWLSKPKDVTDMSEPKPASKPSSPWNPEDCL